MSRGKGTLTANEAWRELIDRYRIAERVEKDGLFPIEARQIKEYREPRLMAKWDSSDSLPDILKRNKLNILPVSHSSYVMGDFLLYQKLPEFGEDAVRIECVELPDFETINLQNINSEANAINVLKISGILDRFLSTGQNTATFNGRMATGPFSFWVDTSRGSRREIRVESAQCEIDGGFENQDSVVILEAKNVIHDDFHVRQLYFPYRMWKNKVKKPIRLVFSVYSNGIFRLFEYRFPDLYDYSSVELVRSQYYALQDTKITLDDLCRVRGWTQPETDDNMDGTDIPFIQANSMDNVITLLEKLHAGPMNSQQIAEFMSFEPRQSDYYFNAGRYLGLFEKNKERLASLTALGEEVYRLGYKERQLKLVGLILRHQIFVDFFDWRVQTGELPDKDSIQQKMREYRVCREGQVARRASSVLGWLRWMFRLK